MKAAARRASLLALVTALAAPGIAAACATCFGAPDSAMTAGMNNGILTLLAVILGVQVGFVALFLKIRSRARELRLRREQFHLLEGGLRR